jgi:hypothetical protein
VAELYALIRARTLVRGMCPPGKTTTSRHSQSPVVPVENALVRVPVEHPITVRLCRG